MKDLPVSIEPLVAEALSAWDNERETFLERTRDIWETLYKDLPALPPWLRALVLSYISAIRHYDGDYQSASALLQQSLRLYEENSPAAMDSPFGPAELFHLSVLRGLVDYSYHKTSTCKPEEVQALLSRSMVLDPNNWVYKGEFAACLLATENEWERGAELLIEAVGNACLTPERLRESDCQRLSVGINVLGGFYEAGLVHDDLWKRVLTAGEILSNAWKKVAPNQPEREQMLKHLAKAGNAQRPSQSKQGFPWAKTLSTVEFENYEQGGLRQWTSGENAILRYFRTVDEQFYFKGPVAFQCRPCGDLYLLGTCPKCRGSLSLDPPTGETLGIYCSRCMVGFDHWNCPNCGTKHRNIDSYLVLLDVEKKSKCFIATVCCSPCHSEIIETLVQFREICLRTSAVGLLAIKVYEKSSPVFAKRLECRFVARAIIRECFLRPVAAMCRLLLRSNRLKNRILTREGRNFKV